VARRVFFHVGLPKTGTTYLQTLLWNNKEELGRQGVLLPGRSPRLHLWASGAVREDPKLSRRGEAAPRAWDELVAEMNAWPGTAVVSHEFFSAASAEQAQRAIKAVQGAEAHIVVTAREMVGLVTARWQEFVKNGATTGIDDYPRTERTNPVNEWGWGTLDLADVLERWGAALPPERVHVIPVPGPELPRDTLWLRFAGLVGIDVSRCDASGTAHNEGLGVVEVELLRKVNADLQGFDAAFDRGFWVRGYLAQGKLVPRNGERFWPSPHRVEQLRERGARSVDAVAARGYDVIGDLDSLRTPDVLPERRHPDEVTDTEMLSAATATIAEMMTDLRRLTQEKRAPHGLTRLRRRLRRMWSRS